MKNTREVKQKVVEALRESPFVQFACRKVGITRQTYYRWKSEDFDFACECDQAMAEGIGDICDTAESKMVEMIGKNDKWAISMLLKHNRRKYQRPSPQDEMPGFPFLRHAQTFSTKRSRVQKIQKPIKRSPVVSALPLKLPVLKVFAQDGTVITDLPELREYPSHKYLEYKETVRKLVNPK